MDADDLNETEFALTQLLVLEAGRILEDLTPDLALKLPHSTAHRHEQLTSMLAALESARSILLAARAREDHAGHPISDR